jgi:hypothetical protein
VFGVSRQQLHEVTQLGVSQRSAWIDRHLTRISVRQLR